MLIDTHAHLQLSEYDSDREAVISRSKTAGVDKILVVGIDLKNSQDAVRLAEEHQNLYASVGLHPHEAKFFTDEILSEFENLARSPKVVAIGETGLDYYRNFSPKGEQQKAFEAQIDLAVSLNLPVIVHNRNSHEDIVEILKKRSIKVQGVMHCFSGSLEIAKECVALGFYISVAGPVTFPNALKLQQTAKSVPIESLLIETDCPWLSPQPHRGQRNEPAHVKYVAQKMSQLKGMNFEGLAKATADNAERLFPKMGKERDSAM